MESRADVFSQLRGGMLVTLSYIDVEWSTKKDMQNNPMIQKFRFIVKVEPVQPLRVQELSCPWAPNLQIPAIRK